MKLRAQGGTKIFGKTSMKMSAVKLKSSRRPVVSVKISSV